MYLHFIDRAVRKIKVRWDDSDELLNHCVTEWKLPQMVEDEDEVERMIGHSNDVYRRGILKVNMNKSKSYIS